MNTIHIICLGNLWWGDDGFGIHVYRQLAKQPLPSHVTLYDAGTLGLGASTCFANCQTAIVVDALENLGEVGKVHRLTGEDVINSDVGDYTTHTIGLNYLLQLLPLIMENQELPNMVIYVAELAEVNLTDQLSVPMQKAVAETVKLIQQDIQEFKV